MKYNPNEFDPIGAYYQGVLDTIERYAIYKDGGRYIGVLENPLAKVKEDVKLLRERAYNENKIIVWGLSE